MLLLNDDDTTRPLVAARAAEGFFHDGLATLASLKILQVLGAKPFDSLENI